MRPPPPGDPTARSRAGPARSPGPPPREAPARGAATSSTNPGSRAAKARARPRRVHARSRGAVRRSLRPDDRGDSWLPLLDSRQLERSHRRRLAGEALDLHERVLARAALGELGRADVASQYVGVAVPAGRDLGALVVRVEPGA